MKNGTYFIWVHNQHSNIYKLKCRGMKIKSANIHQIKDSGPCAVLRWTHQWLLLGLARNTPVQLADLSESIAYASCRAACYLFKAHCMHCHNSHDSQIPIGIAASGSRDWQAEQWLTEIAHCKLSQDAADKPRATLICLSEHRHDWTARVDPASVRPMTTCRSRATGLPKHKALGDWSYKVHRPRLITVSRNHA